MGEGALGRPPQRAVRDSMVMHPVRNPTTVANLPVAREIEAYTFDAMPITEALARDLAGGEFWSQQCNSAPVGRAGTNKTHLSVGIAQAVIRSGASGCFCRRGSAQSTRGCGLRQVAN